MHQGYSDGFQKRIFLSFPVIIILQLNLRTHKSKDMNAHDPMCFCMASSLLTQPGYRPPSICVQIAFLDLHAIANQSNEQLSSPKVPQSEESTETILPVCGAFNAIFLWLSRHGRPGGQKL
jgi:hypothetical protein